MLLKRLTPLPLIPALLLCSCAAQRIAITTPGTFCATSDTVLTEDWRRLTDLRQMPGACGKDNGLTCDALRARIERLSVDCPGNNRVVMANALLAFDAHSFVRAQQLLDELFALGDINPEAGVLRARIAMEQGNMPFALRFLEQQIRQNGDHAGLRETYSSALYLTSRWEEAKQQMGIAQRLGSPVWRISYGLGLIEEAQGNYEQAQLRYKEALRARPDWALAKSRVRALAASGKIPAGN